MLTSLFDFELPPALVALRPVEPRDSARLMVIHPDGRVEHRVFRDLENYLNKGDVLSFNDSRVISARLSGLRPAREIEGAAVPVEVTLHKRSASDRFLAFVKPAKRLRAGDTLTFGAALTAQILSREAGEVELAFDHGGAALDRAIATVGVMPLPPYIAKHRFPDAQDLADYQTIYARHDGSVAAPTAGLHFTPEMMERLEAAGVGMAAMTLHVGAGTFLPVAAEDTRNHTMHAEHAILDADTAARLNSAHVGGGRICAVGTTSLRTLESATDENGEIHTFDSDTSIFITPGYRFRTVDMLVTNFHLPCSTLFMLVSAFMGLETMRRAYAEAIREKYRFYSYGDACLLIRPR
ncbi:MAG TPA: tRNA preQ1(34) S-adenosylmethionine ribosyltransferase-isomerase QueA [Rhizomicrobium sp.]|jgi:S-adenosylmethionine:tRNA ribosyltransferase-isomerase